MVLDGVVCVADLVELVEAVGFIGPLMLSVKWLRISS